MLTILLVSAIIALVLIPVITRALRMRGMKHYRSGEVAARLQVSDNCVLLDVRTHDERRSGHISGSIHIPLHDMENRLGELSPHRGKEIICYCRSGNRSMIAASKLLHHGFSAANLKGGIMEWESVHQHSTGR